MAAKRASRSNQSATHSARAHPQRRPGLEQLLLAILVASTMVEIFRLGWFADDFHLLDIARRIPFWRQLTGQFGIFPWYRPLSRELYFELIVAAGPAALVFAHTVRLFCVFGCAWALQRIAARLVEPRLAPIAPILFVTYEFTKYVTGWSSGFQDLLAEFFILAAIADFADGRRRRSLLWVALAPLAKETGFIALPLLISFQWSCTNERRWRQWLPAHLMAWLAVAALHLAVRRTWTPQSVPLGTPQTLSDLGRILVDVARGFVGHAPVLEPVAVGAALVAGVSALLLLAEFSRTREPRSPEETAPMPSPGRAAVFAALGAGSGIAPMVTSLQSHLTFVHAYHAFPAVPWLAVLAALALGRLPSVAPRIVVPALACWNVWCLGFAAPNLDTPEGWRYHRKDWHDAIRLSQVARRLSGDLQTALAERPDSLVLVYRGIPSAILIQTEDGPAAREILHDPTVRAYFLSTLPTAVDPARVAVVGFDAETFHVRRMETTARSALELSSYAIMCGNGKPGRIFASLADTSGAHGFALKYTRAAARMLEDGTSGFLRSLADAGLTDTLGGAPDSLGYRMLPRTKPFGVAFVSALRHPLNAAAHSEYADQLVAAHFLVTAGVEYRLAVTLDPARATDRLKLATLLAKGGYDDAALSELDRVVREAVDPDVVAQARKTMTWVEATSADPEARMEPDPS